MNETQRETVAVAATPTDAARAEGGKCPIAWWKRLTLLSFLFFLIKGLAWLVVPALVIWWRAIAG